MDLPKCVICKIESRQLLPVDSGGKYTAVCPDCGPYVLDEGVVKELQKGRRLDALKMKEWISAQYDPDNNPRPLITEDVAVWLN